MTATYWPHIEITGLPGGLRAHPAVVALEILLFAYFLAANLVDFALIGIAMRSLPRFMKRSRTDALRSLTMPFAPPVSIVLPVYNEQEHILDVTRSLLEMHYPQFELVIVNDGSSDMTLDLLTQAYGLVPVPEARYVRFKTKAVRGMYRSLKFPNLRVVDKENGGKGDALNAGINESRYPMLFAADGDSIYTADALEQMVQPFIEDPATVGCGANLRILNDSRLVDGRPVRKGLPRRLLVRFQILEYLRAGLTSRFAWSPLNGIMCVSGACALWKKDVIVAAGGYSAKMIWEDAEMTVRVHHYMRAARRRYRIAFVPAGVCWTHVPETLGALGAQRISWHRHITETIAKHRNMLFRRYTGLVGWFALPAYVFLEWMAPLWLLLGLGATIACGVLGILSWEAQAALLAIVFALTILKTALAFVLDEVSYRTYRLAEVWALFVAAMLEQMGYRQLVAVWNIIGIAEFCLERPIRGRRRDVPQVLEAPYRPSAANGTYFWTKSSGAMAGEKK